MSELYEKDLYLWYERMGTALKNRDAQNLDWDCLIEEIEDMAKNQKRALRSYTKRLIEHILKLKYWDSAKEYNSNHWRGEVRNFRDEIEEILQESPSLKNYLKENYLRWYESSVMAKSEEFFIPQDSFVELETILQSDYFG